MRESPNPSGSGFERPNCSSGILPTSPPQDIPKTPNGAILCLIGLLGGLLSGLLGIGGGLVISPLLLLFGILRPAQVAGTTLAVVLVTSTVGSGAYASLGYLNLGIAWPIAVGSAVGCVLGALVSKHLSTRMMTILFLIILPYFALKDLFPSLAGPVFLTDFVPLAILGVSTGLLSGLLGIGGASLVVPSLVGFFLLDHHAAQGIAMGVALADSLAGVFAHARQGNIHYRVLLHLAVPGCAAALGGALLSHSLSSPVLATLFGVLLLTVWLGMVVRLVTDFVRTPPDLSTARFSLSTRKSRSFGLTRSQVTDQAGVSIVQPLVQSVGAFFGRGNAMNVMLLFIPLTILGAFLDFGPVFVFTCCALSCIPLSYQMGRATEALGERLGPVSGGLLNATFGNAAELIIAGFALSHGLFIVARTTLIGSILGQLLLVLGTSLFVAGIKFKKLRFSQDMAQMNFTLMAIAMVAIGLPSVLLAAAPQAAEASLSFLSPVLCVLLLVLYGVSVIFALRNQPQEEGDSSGPGWTPRKGLVILGASTGGMVLISELLVGSILPFVEATGISQVFIGLILIPLFSNVVDHVVAITVAMKNKMNLSMTISVGSAAQIACLVLPIIMLISFTMGQPNGLMFTPVELISLGVGLLMMIPVLLDGKSNWLEGAQLLTCYLVFASVVFGL